MSMDVIPQGSPVEMSGVKMSGVEMSGVEMSGVEMSGVEMSGVEMSEVVRKLYWGRGMALARDRVAMTESR